MNEPIIFIRDDDETLRNLLSECITGFSKECTVIEVMNSAEVLKVAKSGLNKLLITDINGPQEYGVDMVRKIRSKFDHIDFPILVISGNIPEKAAKDLEELNVTYMKKPFPLKALNRYLKIIFRK